MKPRTQWAVSMVAILAVGLVVGLATFRVAHRGATTRREVKATEARADAATRKVAQLETVIVQVLTSARPGEPPVLVVVGTPAPSARIVYATPAPRTSAPTAGPGGITAPTPTTTIRTDPLCDPSTVPPTCRTPEVGISLDNKPAGAHAPYWPLIAVAAFGLGLTGCRATRRRR